MASSQPQSAGDESPSWTQTSESNPDPYSSSGPNPSNSPFAIYPTKVEIPPCGFIKSCLFLSPERYEKNVSRYICTKLDIILVYTRRWPTQGETDACIAHANTQAVAGRTGFLAGSAAALRLCLHPASMEMLFSPFKRVPRLLRMPIVGVLFPASGVFLGSLWTAGYEMIRYSRDPRMRGLYDEIVSMGVSERTRRAKEYRAHEDAKRSARRSQSESPNPVAMSRSSTGDDASPTAGGFSSDYEQSYDRQQEDPKVVRAAYSRQETGQGTASQDSSMYPSQYQQNPLQQGSQQPRQHEEQPYDSPSGLSKNDDDMLGGDEAAPASKSTGDVWDRIRQQPKPPQQQQSQSQSQWQSFQRQPPPPSQDQSRWKQIQQQSQPTQEDQSDSSQASSWSFSQPSYPPQEPSQDTNSEKEKAQREFDSLLERERNLGTGGGGVGEDGKGSGGSWGRRW